MNEIRKKEIRRTERNKTKGRIRERGEGRREGGREERERERERERESSEDGLTLFLQASNHHFVLETFVIDYCFVSFRFPSSCFLLLLLLLLLLLSSSLSCSYLE